MPFEDEDDVKTAEAGTLKGFCCEVLGADEAATSAFRARASSRRDAIKGERESKRK
jgi:hypothetical protein